VVLGVAREGSEPSLFYAVSVSESTLSAQGWYLAPALPERFELELWVQGEKAPERSQVFVVNLPESERKKTCWYDQLKLEIFRGL